MNRQASRTRNAEVMRRFVSGERVAALAAEFDLTPNYIYALARNAGCGRSGEGRVFRAPKRHQILRRHAVMTELHSLGVSGGASRKLMGVSQQIFSVAARKLGLKFPYDNSRWEQTGRESQKRAAKMAAMYRSGMTLQQIGDKHGISRERVRQLMTKHEQMRAEGGGQHMLSVAKKQMSAATKDKRYLDKYGCTFAQYVEVREIGRVMRAGGAGVYMTPLRAFISQKNNAKFRDIPWKLTFWQWWSIWQQSGKWSQRGRFKHGYVMSRFGDTGAYAAGNVYIGTLSENSSIQPNNPYRLDHPDHTDYPTRTLTVEQRISCGLHAPKRGLPAGVTFHKGRFQAQARISGKNKYLGRFGTAGEAHAAYLQAVTADVNTAHKISAEA